MMGLFGQSTPFDADVEKATSEKNTTELWGVIMDICDKVGSNPRHAKDCLKSIMKRMAHTDPHVVIQAITLLDACVNNCGKPFHLEVASREFENEFKRLLTKAQPQVATKMRVLLKKWAENDFVNDPQLNLIPSLYHKLKSEGHDFTDTTANQKTTKSIPAAVLKDPNVVSSQQEEEDIAKAIELSLKETKSSPKKQTTTSSTTYPNLYPSFSMSTSTGTTTSLATGTPSSIPAQQEPRKVRALYDFEAAEDNELTFAAGDIIHVLDDSDPNWWKGYNQNGEGLFPSNFVTADLSVEPERLDINNQKTKKSVQFEDQKEDAEKISDDKLDTDDDNKNYVPEVNEEKIDRLLHLLHEANPEDPSQDSEEMLRLEDQVNKMGPLIDSELERVDRKHAQLTQLSSDLVDAINLYHTLMREPDRTNMPMMTSGYFPGGGYGVPQVTSQNLYSGPSNAYGMQNMYQGPTSLPGMQMMHSSMPGQNHQQNVGGPNSIASHLPQIPIPTVSGQTNNFPVQMIPIQYQNGHQPPTSVAFPPASLQQQQTQQSSIGPQYQSQAPHSFSQQMQNPISTANQPMTSQNQQNSQQQQQQPPSSQQHQGVNPQMNPNFSLPPNTSIPSMFPSLPQGAINYMPNMPGGLPITMLGQYQMPPPPPPTTSNGFVGNQTSHSLPYNNNNDGSVPIPHPQQFQSINQPVTQTILGQNDSKTTIPIHQQQR